MRTKQSLVELAKSIKVGKRNTSLNDDELELVKAWLNDEVQLGQVMKALKKTSGNVYVFIALGARTLWQNGRK